MSRRTNYHYDELDEDEDENFNQLRTKVKVLKEVSGIHKTTQSTPIHKHSCKAIGCRRLTILCLLCIQVSIQIGEETREHNKYLRELDTRADSVFGSLSLNMEQVKRLARSGNNRVVFYLLAFTLFVVLVIYLINRSL